MDFEDLEDAELEGFRADGEAATVSSAMLSPRNAALYPSGWRHGTPARRRPADELG